MPNTLACNANMHKCHHIIMDVRYERFSRMCKRATGIGRRLTDYVHDVRDCDNVIHNLWLTEAVFITFLKIITVFSRQYDVDGGNVSL